MERLHRNLHHLHVLSNSKPKLSKALMKTCDDELVKCVCECCANVIKGHVPVSNAVKEKLKKHKTTLRFLSDKKVPLSKKRKRLIQKGGFLPLLLPAIIGAAANIIPALVKK